MVKERSVEGELINEFSEVIVVEVLGIAGERGRCKTIFWVLLEGNGSTGGEGVSVLVKLLDKKGPPFVEGPDGVVCGLDLGYVCGSDEVEQEVGSKYRFFGPLSDIEKGEGKRCGVVTDFFAVGDDGHYLLEVGLVVKDGRFREPSVSDMEKIS